MRDQAVTNGQQCINFHGLIKGQAVLDHTNEQAADNVNKENKDTGYGVPFYELTGTVHRAVEIGFTGYVTASGFGFFLID